MSEQPETERGAAEEASGTPLTDTEVDASTRPPSQPAAPDGDDSSATGD